jgi:hypothetical protein
MRTRGRLFALYPVKMYFLRAQRRCTGYRGRVKRSRMIRGHRDGEGSSQESVKQPQFGLVQPFEMKR